MDCVAWRGIKVVLLCGMRIGYGEMCACEVCVCVN